MAARTNTKISNDMIIKSYEVGKLVYKEKLNFKEGIKQLTKMGMNKNSAADYVYNYSNLIQGKLFTRTTSSFATDYYLGKIHQEDGIQGLKKALLSLSQHIDYYEDKSGSSVKKRKDVYLKYLKLLDLESNEKIYPDEVDDTIEYSEGKAKQVLVNTYERNLVARQVCIDHYGASCKVCDFDFQKTFGEIGKGFIHIHHIVDLATIGEEYSVDPISDLIPVCPNCHAMLHRQRPAYKIEDLRGILKKSRE
jgi:5-methylcytosine-specific restriction protein A